MDTEEYLVLLGIVAALVLIFGALIAVDAAACNRRYASYGETSYGVIQGCMVKHNGKWVPSDAIREIP